MDYSNNPALRSFIQMRRSLATKTETKTPAPSNSMTALPKPNDRITLKYIIEEKPTEKEVRDYLKQRIEELSKDEDES